MNAGTLFVQTPYIYKNKQTTAIYLNFTTFDRHILTGCLTLSLFVFREKKTGDYSGISRIPGKLFKKTSDKCHAEIPLRIPEGI